MKKIKSLYRKNKNLTFFKIINFVLRQGKKEKAATLFFSAFYLCQYFFTFTTKSKIKHLDYNLQLMRQILTEDVLTSRKHNFIDWKTVLIPFSRFFYNSKQSKTYYFDTQLAYNEKTPLMLNYGYTLENNSMTTENTHSLKSFFEQKFKKSTPTFAFNIKNVDKKVYKFSRGKSGKYKIKWQFIVFFKRLTFFIKMFIKEVKFLNGFKYKHRLYNVVHNFLTNNPSTQIFLIKNFSHNYIRLNFKKNLFTIINNNF